MSARRRRGIRVRPQFGLVTDMRGTVIPDLKWRDGGIVVSRAVVDDATRTAVADVLAGIRRDKAVDAALRDGRSLSSIAHEHGVGRVALARRRRELWFERRSRRI